MRPPIDDGVVMITGASSGIGKALARRVAPRARVLILVARRLPRLETLAEELRKAHGRTVEPRSCDLADLAATERLMAAIEAEHQGVDVLINNAGMGDISMLSEASWPKLDTMIRLNVLSLTFLCHRVLPRMLSQGRGGILNVSSSFGLTWMPMFASYVGTKHYVTTFSDSLRAEVAGTGVVVSQLCPGPVATEFLQHSESPVEPTGVSLIEISAERCAREAIWGFDRNWGMIRPGLLVLVAVSFGRVLPAIVLRWFYAILMRLLRSRLRHQRGD